MGEGERTHSALGRASRPMQVCCAVASRARNAPFFLPFPQSKQVVRLLDTIEPIQLCCQSGCETERASNWSDLGLARRVSGREEPPLEVVDDSMGSTSVGIVASRNGEGTRAKWRPLNA